MSNCIINVGSGNWYPKGTARLKESLIYHGYPGKILTWIDTLPEGSPTHKESPYAFKIHAFYDALSQGYTNLLWLDCSVWCIRYPEYHMAQQQKDGYYILGNGDWKCDEWTNDHCLEHFGLTREQAAEIPMISSGILGLDFTTEIAREFLSRWANSMEAGCFRGPWSSSEEEREKYPRHKGHRHDQSCASIIAHQLGMTIQPTEIHDMYYRPQMPETVEFALQGM